MAPVSPKHRTGGLTRDYIYTELKKKIVNLELKPGSRISEKDISEKWNVSRTPVREAFLKLSEEELLDVYPQSGTFVSKIDLEHVEEARFVREQIETGIVRLACAQFPEEHVFQLETNVTMQTLCEEKGNYAKLYELDDEFHRILFDGCHKTRAWKLMQQMNTHFDRLRRLRLASALDWDIIVSQHKDILSLVKSKKTEEAVNVMREHLRLAVVEKDVLKQSNPDFFK